MATRSTKIKSEPNSKPAAKPLAVPPPEPAVATPESISDQEHQQVIDLLKGRCLEMSFTIHNLPKSRRVASKQAEVAAQALKGKRKGIRSSWSMFLSDHPAVRELNAAIRDLEALRDNWTVVRSAEVKKGENNKTSIEGGKRLIWDEDVNEFYKLFVAKAKDIDRAAAKVQNALNNQTKDADGNTIKSIKEIDRENSGDAWDEAAYPQDVQLVVGVAKERLPDGSDDLDEEGEPKYIINFHEYHVSEKLSDTLRKRAVERLDAKLSETVDTAFDYAVSRLTDSLTGLMDELGNRTKLFPVSGHELAYLCQHGDAEVLKTVTRDSDFSIPEGMVKVQVAYRGYETVAGQKTEIVNQLVSGSEPTQTDDSEKKAEPKPEDLKRLVSWFGPMKIDDYQAGLRPQVTGERKKIYPGVIEGIISKMQSFRDKQAKILGPYGQNALSAFEGLFKELTKLKGWSGTNDEAAQKLAAKLRTSAEARQELGQAIAETISNLSDQVVTVKDRVKRRSISASLIGKVGQEDN